MKIYLKLDQRSSKLTASGYPIIIYFFKDKKNKSQKTIGYNSSLKNWSVKNTNVKPSHPDYASLFDEIEDWKQRARQIEKKATKDNWSIADAKAKILKKSNDVFYDECLVYFKGKPSGGVDMSALNKFQKFFPDLTYDEITTEVVEDFKKACLSSQCNNGTHAYLRSLTTAWNNLSKNENPFSIVKKPKKEATRQKNLGPKDVRKIMAADFSPTGKTDIGGAFHYRNYFMLMLLLGGIDAIDLANLKEENFINGRVKFRRGKGNTSVFINNKVLPEAKEILDYYAEHYEMEGYVVPIYRYTNHKYFTDNFAKRFPVHCEQLKLTERPLIKTARYTFINQAKQLLIAESITKEIVGHSETGVHSIYQDKFPLKLRDKVHYKIIKSLLYKKKKKKKKQKAKLRIVS